MNNAAETTELKNVITALFDTDERDVYTRPELLRKGIEMLDDIVQSLITARTLAELVDPAIVAEHDENIAFYAEWSAKLKAAVSDSCNYYLSGTYH